MQGRSHPCWQLERFCYTEAGDILNWGSDWHVLVCQQGCREGGVASADPGSVSGKYAKLYIQSSGQKLGCGRIQVSQTTGPTLSHISFSKNICLLERRYLICLQSNTEKQNLPDGQTVVYGPGRSQDFSVDGRGPIIVPCLPPPSSMIRKLNQK